MADGAVIAPPPAMGNNESYRAWKAWNWSASNNVYSTFTDAMQGLQMSNTATIAMLSYATPMEANQVGLFKVAPRVHLTADRDGGGDITVLRYPSGNPVNAARFAMVTLVESLVREGLTGSLPCNNGSYLGFPPYTVEGNTLYMKSAPISIVDPTTPAAQGFLTGVIGLLTRVMPAMTPIAIKVLCQKVVANLTVLRADPAQAWLTPQVIEALTTIDDVPAAVTVLITAAANTAPAVAAMLQTLAGAICSTITLQEKLERCQNIDSVPAIASFLTGATTVTLPRKAVQGQAGMFANQQGAVLTGTTLAQCNDTDLVLLNKDAVTSTHQVKALQDPAMQVYVCTGQAPYKLVRGRGASAQYGAIPGTVKMPALLWKQLQVRLQQLGAALPQEVEVPPPPPADNIDVAMDEGDDV